MAFTPSTTVIHYIKGPPPLIEESERRYFDNELRKLSISLRSLTDAITELSDYVKTLP
jgi:hypothetical protein